MPSRNPLSEMPRSTMCRVEETLQVLYKMFLLGKGWELHFVQKSP